MLKKRSKDRIEEETYTLNPVRMELQKKLGEINARIDSLKTREKALSILTEKYNEKVSRLPDQQAEFTRLTRNYATNNQIYQSLLNKLELAQISQRLEEQEQGAKFKLVDPPSLPHKPIKPKRKRILILGIAMGFMLGIGGVVGVEYMDKSFKTDKGLAELVGVPVLSSIPRMLTEQEEALRKAKRRLTIILLVVFALSMVIFVGIKYVAKIKK